MAPYIPEANPNAPVDPVRALADRQRAAIASRMKDPTRAAVDSAGVDGASPLPKPGKTGSPQTPATPHAPSTKDSPASASDTSSPKTEGAKSTSTDSASPSTPSKTTESEPSASDSPEASQTSAPKEPRINLKSFKRWAEANPEEAAEIRTVVFKADADSTQEWIRVQNKIRKVKQEHRTSAEKTAAEAAAVHAQALADRKAAEDAAGSLRPVLDLWGGATRKDAKGETIPDFDAVDHAFEMTAQMPIDEYMRKRARRGVANPENARQRAEIARLQRELDAAKQNGTGAAAASTPAAEPSPSPAAKAAAPVDFDAKWGEELPKGHKLRQLTGWAAALDAEMDKYHDAELDEYSRDPEDVADALLKRQLASFIDEEAPEPKKKPANGKPNTPKKRAADLPPPPKGHREATEDDLSDAGPSNQAERERWALKRAQERMMKARRGETA